MNHTRIILAALSILLLVGLMIYSFQARYENHPQIQKLTNLFEHPNQWNNTEISFYAEVLSVNTTTRTLRVFIQQRPYTYPQVIINTGELDIQDLKKGDLIDVIGRFHPDNQLTATYLWRNEQWKNNLIYLRSLPAIPLILFVFFKTWTLDTTTWRFKRRNNHA